MKKALAFLKRDAQIATSYKTAFTLQLVSIVAWVPVFYFIDRGVPAAIAGSSAAPAGAYFASLVSGFGLLGYLTISLRTFNESIRESQLMGTLEIVLLSPTSIAQLLTFSSLWVYLLATIRFVLLLGFGALFGLELGSADVVSIFAVLALAIPAFASFGIASAALILVIKRGESINLVLPTASLILGGVMFPVEVLPAWLQSVSNLLPITHALKAMRLALFEGSSVVELAPELGVLALFTLVLLPISLGSFWLAVRWTKSSGTLAHY